MSFNTATSFTTNTNWQSYGGETTMSYLSQAVALTSHNFFSAGVGIVVAIALIRGIARNETDKIGNFWVDLVRVHLYVLLPICLVYALFLVSQGVIQNFAHPATWTTLDGATQTIVQGPVASQEAIKMLGTNGGGYFNANSAHPFENPTPLSNLVQMLSIFAIGGALCVTLGEMLGNKRHGWAVFATMTLISVAAVFVVGHFEAAGNPLLSQLGVDQATSATAARRQHGGQGGPLRHPRLLAVHRGHDRRFVRRGQHHARQPDAARRARSRCSTSSSARSCSAASARACTACSSTSSWPSSCRV